MLVITFSALESLIEFTAGEFQWTIESMLDFLTGKSPGLSLKDIKGGAILKEEELWHLCIPIPVPKEPDNSIPDLGSPNRNSVRKKKLRLNTIRMLLDNPNGPRNN